MINDEIRHDTILVTIADTAAQSCRCNCRYVLHVEFEGLLLPSYVFVCRREDYASQYILYTERVNRESPVVYRSAGASFRTSFP
jgi:hypothetical protein